MTDSIEPAVKTDAEKALSDIKAETAKLETDGKSEFIKVESYVKAHTAWIIGIVCSLVGFGAGWLCHLK